MAKKKLTVEEYIVQIPLRHPSIQWNTDDKGMITLEIENTGWANRIAQKLFKRPKITYVHLDETGSFVWPLIDGQTSIKELGVPVEERFGEAAQPLYPRLAKYFQILRSYNFILFKS